MKRMFSIEKLFAKVLFRECAFAEVRRTSRNSTFAN